MAEVRLLAGLRECLGGGAHRLSVTASNVGELLEALVARSPDAQRARSTLYAGGAAGALHEDLRVLVNGRSIQFLDGAQTPLDAADAVTLHLAGSRGYPGG